MIEILEAIEGYKEEFATLHPPAPTPEPEIEEPTEPISAEGIKAVFHSMMKRKPKAN